jgi:hypothetical protein
VLVLLQGTCIFSNRAASFFISGLDHANNLVLRKFAEAALGLIKGLLLVA